jgi:hypothetical protein
VKNEPAAWTQAMLFRRWTSLLISGICKTALAPGRGTLFGATATFTCRTAFAAFLSPGMSTPAGIGGAELGGRMFEDSQEPKPSAASKGLWVAFAVVVIAIAIGGYLFISKAKANKPTPVAAAASVQPTGPADPVRDLKIQRATMDKDRTGTTAVWLVSIENRSPSYTYSDIQYETTYVGANNNAILINKGTIKTSIEPGGQKSSQINDALYPAGTAWYKIRITGATASAQ